MADKHPYISGGGAIVQLLDQLRKSFPGVLNAEVLKKLSIAPSNESYAINIVRFLGLIDDAGNRTSEALKTFTLHDDASFQNAFSEILKTAYHELFSLRGEGAWTLTQDHLVPFFRQTDQSSALVGGRQASTFKVLAAYAGHGDAPTVSAPRAPRNSSKRASRTSTSESQQAAPVTPPQQPIAKPDNSDRVALTVRIEVNLPSAGDQETYDRIFRSIRENLLNA